MTVTRLVYKTQIEKFYGESRYLLNKNFLSIELREKIGLDPVVYNKRQYFFPNEFQIIIDHHQLTQEEVDDILSQPK